MTASKRSTDKLKILAKDHHHLLGLELALTTCRREFRERWELETAFSRWNLRKENLGTDFTVKLNSRVTAKQTTWIAFGVRKMKWKSPFSSVCFGLWARFGRDSA